MTLQTEIKTRNFEISAESQTYILKKVSPLAKHFKRAHFLLIELFYRKSRIPTERYVVQLTLSGKILGKEYQIRAEEVAENFLTAFEAALKELRGKTEKFEDKRLQFDRQAPSLLPGAIRSPSPADPVARRQAYLLKPMSEAEALEQMRLLGNESFFLFRNLESNEVNLLYRRNERDYGLIIPVDA